MKGPTLITSKASGPGKAERFDYYRAFGQQATYAHELACNLRSAIAAGELGSRELMSALHTVENDADQVNHEIHQHLMADFTTPLERDGMGQLAHVLDDVCDSLEDAAVRAYCFHCNQLYDGGEAMLRLLTECTAELVSAVELLDGRGNWRDGGVHACLLKVQELESCCDEVFVNSLHDLYGDRSLDPEQRRVAHAMLESLECAMDQAEAAAECIHALMANNL